MDGFDPVYGARPLKRLVQRDLVDRIANEIVAGKVHEGDTVQVDLDANSDYVVNVIPGKRGQVTSASEDEVRASVEEILDSDDDDPIDPVIE